ncbi:hypothetical protein KUTeg_003887 [Tegillarca granosa]|uniref:Fibronectin type-III domain-containing protein n=1 Tax=Tegillarca granosa TaxID=220873 RepID=A0ABQ9FQ17_TEGGR|nr:hypothetical protein KUTeg_003887 [Tegillarca granosa]
MKVSLNGDGRTIKVFMTDSNNLTVNDGTRIPSSPSVPVRLRNMNGSLSPNKPTKSLNVNMQKKRGSTSSDPDSVSPSKTLERKKVEKEKKQSYDNSALFEAVEQQDIDLVKSVLECEGVDINSFNSEYLTPLDVAVMTNNIPMAKMLLYHGAKEIQREDSRLAHLDSLVSDAEKKVVDLSAAILNASSGSATLSNTQQKENEKQLSHWEFRHKLLKRMKAGYDHARTPDPPSYVSLSVASSSSLCVKFEEPLNHNGAVVTRYKVEWSCFEDFMPLAGEDIVENMRNLEYEICGLVKGNKYYVGEM